MARPVDFPGPEAAEGEGGLLSDLRDAYAVVTPCLLHPRERDRSALTRRVKRLSGPFPTVAEPVGDFLVAPEAWSEEHFLQTLELAPSCPPYVGAHLFDEPDSCRGAARSDRNPYMVELWGVYRHFGWQLAGRELPDYLPLMTEFLRLTLDAEDERDLSIRRYYLQELFVPGLEPLERSLERTSDVYALPVRALGSAVERDLGRLRKTPVWTPPRDAARPVLRCGQRLAGITQET